MKVDSTSNKYSEILESLKEQSFDDEECKKILGKIIKSLDRLRINKLVFREELNIYSSEDQTELKQELISEDYSSDEAKERRWYAFLCLIIGAVFSPEDTSLLFECALRTTHEQKHGSLIRHLTIYSLFASADFHENSLIFSKISAELRFLTEFLFNEIFPILQSGDTKYAPEELDLLSQKFLGFMRAQIFAFLERNADNNSHLNPKMKILRHTDFFEFEFVTNRTLYHSKINRNLLNANSLLVLIGNLLAKLDMAIFFV